MIAIDNTFLTLLFYPEAKAPNDPATGRAIPRLGERIEELVEQWRTDRERILIPAPALSEFLMLAGDDGPLYLAEIDSDPIYKVGDFDTKAAVELAAMNLEIKKESSRTKQKKEALTDTKSKLTFDKQIVAISIANGVSRIYSDDKGVENFAKRRLIPVVKSWDLRQPSAKQMSFAEGR